MGKVTGFIDHARRGLRKRDPETRALDYLEIYEDPTPEEIGEQAARCMDCGIPFCHDGCPLGNIIPDWNDLAYRGKWREALERLHRTNSFPEFTGRICPAPCESACVLGINDDPVTIEIVERTIVERGFAEGWIVPRLPEARSGRTVAVIGSGPAGLAAAGELNRAGHRVTVLERQDRLGGLLRYGIPDFKLEKWTIDRRLEVLQAEGIEFRTGVQLGVDVSLEELRASHDAVLLATGSERPRELQIPGRDLSGIHFAMEFLEQQNRRGAGDAIDDGVSILATMKNVVVLGGGDTGSDCVGTSLRQRAKHVYNFELLEKPPTTRPAETPWPVHPLPAQMLQTSTSHEEGGERDWGISTTRFSGTAGRVEKLHATRVRFGAPDPETGRRPIETIPGTELSIEVDLVLLALGFVGPRHEGLLEGSGVELTERGTIATQGFVTALPDVFAAGDARRGQSLVVWAIAEGRQAAAAIDTYLGRRG